jgi:P4 family phage/plasmid primase-like protien
MCPTWLGFLEDATQADAGLVRFLQQIAGYCLTGDTREHALFFIYGPGGNGKSVFLNTLNGILADYAETAVMDAFAASAHDKHSTDIAMLRGARLVSVSETEEGRAWAETRVKQLTGGDKVTARFMRQNNFTFTPRFKLVIVGNHKPVLTNVDDAAKRRFNMLIRPSSARSAQPVVVPRSRARMVGVAAGAAGTGRLALRSGRVRVATAMVVSLREAVSGGGRRRSGAWRC